MAGKKERVSVPLGAGGVLTFRKDRVFVRSLLRIAIYVWACLIFAPSLHGFSEGNFPKLKKADLFCVFFF